MSSTEDNNISSMDSKMISEPPLSLLFNPSLLTTKKDVWDIDVTMLLDMLLKLIGKTGKKDLRVCGIAALSSSIIYRLKVESIFRLEKIAMQRKGVDEHQQYQSIPDLNPVEIPFRIESTYPVSLEDLLQVLENMISELANPKPKKKQLDLEPVESFDFDQYLIKFEHILQRYEDMIFDIVSADGEAIFKILVAKMESIEIVRCFIAVLYLAMKGKIDLVQIEEDLKLIRR
ncbi:MAG: chromosome segregation protein ScpA [Thermoproteota archaeon]|nr:chromosome segregation protein ScpA [Thermoproteota archaeon]